MIVVVMVKIFMSPKQKKTRMEKNSDMILQSTPKKRGRGRPKGSKNKKVSGANKKGIGHKIQKKQTSSRKNGKGKNIQKGGESTGDSNEADDTNLVDDKENNNFISSQWIYRGRIRRKNIHFIL